MDQKIFEKQWISYANGRLSRRSRYAAGGVVVAGGALFSLQSHADAGIVYTPITTPALTISNTKNSSKTVPVSPPGGPVIKFEGYFFKSTTLLRGQSGKGNVGGIKAIAGLLITNGVMPATNGVKKLAAGDMITSMANFHSVSKFGTFQAPLHVKSGGKVLGDFPINGPQHYFLGFQLTGGAYNGDLGYIELSVENTGGDPAYANKLVLDAFAYDTIPGQAIAAGAVPEPDAATLVTPLLVLAGAAGSLKAWRKRKQAA